MLGELESLLAASSMQANTLLQENAALIRAALGPLGTALELRIRNFLYPEALEARLVAFLSLAREIAHWHHEKWDGSGFPTASTRSCRNPAWHAASTLSNDQLA